MSSKKQGLPQEEHGRGWPKGSSGSMLSANRSPCSSATSSLEKDLSSSSGRQPMLDIDRPIATCKFVGQTSCRTCLFHCGSIPGDSIIVTGISHPGPQVRATAVTQPHPVISRQPGTSRQWQLLAPCGQLSPGNICSLCSLCISLCFF